MCSGRPTWPAPPSAYTSGTTNELNLADWARANHVEVKPLVFDQNEETRNAYNAGRCDAFTTDASQLAGIRTALRDPSRARHPARHHLQGNRSRSRCARATTVVRHRPLDGLRAVRGRGSSASPRPMWTEMLNSQNPAIRRLLGQAGGPWPADGPRLAAGPTTRSRPSAITADIRPQSRRRLADRLRAASTTVDPRRVDVC